MALMDMDSQYQECSWEWVGGCPLIWKCFFHTHVVRMATNNSVHHDTCWPVFSLTFELSITIIRWWNLHYHFILAVFFLFCWQSYKKTVALQSHVKVDLIWTFCGKTSKKVTSTETVDIFWSDDYEFVISEKERMYFTKTIRIEEDELRHER